MKRTVLSILCIFSLLSCSQARSFEISHGAPRGPSTGPPGAKKALNDPRGPRSGPPGADVRGLSSPDPGGAFGGGVVEVAVVGVGEEFAAGVLDGKEVPGVGTAASANP